MQSVAGPVVDLIEQIGEVGVGLLIALETVVPPIPSEVVLPFAGFAAAEGRIDPMLAWVAATAGSLAGALLLYWVGARWTYARLHDLAGRPWFILFGRRDLERGHAFFGRHGSAVILVGRFIPFVRSVVSVPAGLERMPVPRFLLLTAVGSGTWNAVFLLLGYRLREDFAVVEQWLAPVSTAVVVLLALGLVLLALRRRRETAGAASPAAPAAEPAPATDHETAVSSQDSSRQDRQRAA
jgi:membrane protein DedA with SNARE-associated domain